MGTTLTWLTVKQKQNVLWRKPRDFSNYLFRTIFWIPNKWTGLIGGGHTFSAHAAMGEGNIYIL